MDLKKINDEIFISVCDASSHRRLNSLQKRHKNLTQSVVSLQIPNRLFVLWSKKLSLPYCSGCNSIFKRSALVNLSLQQGTVLANTDALEFRLQKSISNVVNKIKRHKGGSKAKLEKETTHFALYEEEIICCSLDTSGTAAEGSAASTFVSNVASPLDLISGKKKVMYVYTQLITILGGNYATLGDVQKSRRRKEIGRAILDYTSPIGIQVASVNLLQTTTKSIILLQLFPSIRVLKGKEAQNDSCIIPQVSHLLLRYGVSEECYHEITQIIGGPKSYKVK